MSFQLILPSFKNITLNVVLPTMNPVKMTTLLEQFVSEQMIVGGSCDTSEVFEKFCQWKQGKVYQGNEYSTVASFTQYCWNKSNLIKADKGKVPYSMKLAANNMSQVIASNIDMQIAQRLEREDTIASFIGQCTIQKVDSKVRTYDLYARWCIWLTERSKINPYNSSEAFITEFNRNYGLTYRNVAGHIYNIILREPGTHDYKARFDNYELEYEFTDKVRHLFGLTAEETTIFFKQHNMTQKEFEKYRDSRPVEYKNMVVIYDKDGNNIGEKWDGAIQVKRKNYRIDSTNSIWHAVLEWFFQYNRNNRDAKIRLLCELTGIRDDIVVGWVIDNITEIQKICSKNLSTDDILECTTQIYEKYCNAVELRLKNTSNYDLRKITSDGSICLALLPGTTTLLLGDGKETKIIPFLNGSDKEMAISTIEKTIDSIITIRGVKRLLSIETYDRSEEGKIIKYNKYITERGFTPGNKVGSNTPISKKPDEDTEEYYHKISTSKPFFEIGVYNKRLNYRTPETIAYWTQIQDVKPKTPGFNFRLLDDDIVGNGCLVNNIIEKYKQSKLQRIKASREVNPLSAIQQELAREALFDKLFNQPIKTSKIISVLPTVGTSKVNKTDIKITPAISREGKEARIYNKIQPVTRAVITVPIVLSLPTPLNAPAAPTPITLNIVYRCDHLIRKRGKKLICNETETFCNIIDLLTGEQCCQTFNHRIHETIDQKTGKTMRFCTEAHLMGYYDLMEKYKFIENNKHGVPKTKVMTEIPTSVESILISIKSM